MIGMLFGMLALMLIIGVPIATSLGVAVVAVMIQTGSSNLYPVVAQRMFTSVDNFTLMAVPFFILAGNLMGEGGISKRLIGFVQTLLRRQPAALASITTVASAFFGAISGSNPATVAAIGGITIPRMRESGYPSDQAAAVAASSGTLGVVIPPSIPMVTYAVTASVSVGTMFLAGIVPGILLAFALVLTNRVICKKYEPADKDAPRMTFKAFAVSFKNAIFALLMPVIILGGIYGGIFTPTEAAAVSCVYALIISMFVFKELKLNELRGIFIKSAVSSAIVLFVVSLSAPFAWFMTNEGIPAAIANGVLGAFSNKYIVFLMMNVILLFLGCFLETQSIILLITPILLPITVNLGMDPIALGIIIIINTSIGMITPPMAVNLFVASGIAKVSIEGISRRIIPFLLVEIGVLLILTYIPQVILWLPSLMGV